MMDGCSACDRLGQTPTPEHLEGVARLTAEVDAVDRTTAGGYYGGLRLSDAQDETLRRWPLDRIRPKTVALGVRSLLAEVDALRAERDAMQARAEEWRDKALVMAYAVRDQSSVAETHIIARQVIEHDAALAAGPEARDESV